MMSCAEAGWEQTCLLLGREAGKGGGGMVQDEVEQMSGWQEGIPAPLHHILHPAVAMATARKTGNKHWKVP